LTKIQILDLSQNNLTSEGAFKLFSSISKFHHLKRLSLEGNNFCNYKIFSIEILLNSNEHLKEINLANCKIEDHGGISIGDGLRRNYSSVWMVLAFMV